MTLADFLLARIAEDERRANSRYEPRDPFGSLPRVTLAQRDELGRAPHGWLHHGTEHQRPVTQEMFDAWYQPKPDTRLLAECEAKRRIITLASGAWNGSDCTECNEAGYMGDDLLRLLALPYADHPEFDEEWRP